MQKNQQRVTARFETTPEASPPALSIPVLIPGCMMRAFNRRAVVNAITEKLNLQFLGWHYLFLLLFFVTLPFLAGILPIVRFTDEQINIRVFNDHVEMQGTYVYQNPFPFPVVQGLAVPLPADADHPTPVQISARQQGPKQKPLVTRYLLGRHRFNVFFKANERIQIAVEYQEKEQIDAHQAVGKSARGL